ncbi:fructose-6-phosphate aldolase [Candidatus Dojkabacteria bacterium]|uniref:Fructose-6-phosphate aldolase n=1 Tax=Candidatus Dojkabacteria bacterium TaxID=2099670 RepID=A0A955RKB8_9BACT|nr:fructose-6-phosphate aldolase [Candidatus Dojkabacteria bacterium]
MELFIDSANPEEVIEAYATGMINGVTTNPSLAAKAGIPYKEAVQKIIKAVQGPISLEVLSTEFKGMVEEGRKLIKYGENVVVKIPMTVDGIKATQILKHEGINVNMTLVFSTYQALLAAKAGADYVSPFVGRLDDGGTQGMQMIEEIRQSYDNYGFETKILVASVRSTLHVEESSIYGADVATIPPGVFWKLFEHPLSKLGLEQFLKDFKEAGVEPLV